MRVLNALILLLVVLFIPIIYYAIFPYSSPSWMGFNGDQDVKIKTLWDWLDLLIVPITIGLMGVSYKSYEKAKEENRQKEIYHNETLESYFKNMSELILKNNLLDSSSNHKVIILARTRTIVVLESLDNARKGQVLQFLKESELLNSVNILGSNFSNSDVQGIVLKKDEFKGVNFKKTNFRDSYLDDTKFISCNLEYSDFTNASLDNVDFCYSNLKNCVIKNVDLTAVKFYGAELENADLRGSRLTKKQLKEITRLNKGIKYNNNKNYKHE